MIMKKNTSKTVFHLNVDDRQCNSKNTIMTSVNMK